MREHNVVSNYQNADYTSLASSPVETAGNPAPIIRENDRDSFVGLLPTGEQHGRHTRRSRLTLAQRFARKVRLPVDPDACWDWIGGTTADGYGFMRPASGNTTVGAHRVAYELFVGPIPPPRQTVDHRCRHRACVNPAHLEAVSLRENQARGLEAVKRRRRPLQEGAEHRAVQRALAVLRRQMLDPAHIGGCLLCGQPVESLEEIRADHERQRSARDPLPPAA